MIYANDQWMQLPTVDLYDTQMMAMAINAARDMYEKGLQEIKDFNKLYGDFMTQVPGDYERYDKAIMEPVRNVIDAIYQSGGNPLTSPEARMLVSSAIARIPIKKALMLRLRAENAREYYKNRAELIKNNMYDDYISNQIGEDPSKWGEDTMGITTPTPILNMADFTKPWYNNIKPTITSETKDGISYTRKVLSEQDLRNVAEANYNDIISTAQGKALHDMYLKSTGSEEAAKKQLIDEVVGGNTWRLQNDSDYNDAEHLKLLLQRRNLAFLMEKAKQQLALQQRRNEILAAKQGKSNSKDGSGNDSKTPVSYYEPLYQNLVINTLNKDPFRLSTFANKEFDTSMGNMVLLALRNIANQYFSTDGVGDIYGGNNFVNRTDIDYLNKDLAGRLNIQTNLNKTVDESLSNSLVFRNNFNLNYKKYLNQFTGGNDRGFSSVFANSWKQGQAKVDNVTSSGTTIDKLKGKNYVYFDADDIDYVYSAKELSARMAGITGSVLEDAKLETKRIRNNLRNVLNNGYNVIMRASSPIGAGLSDIGSYGIYANVRLKSYDDSALFNDGASNLGEVVIATPFVSAPNPNASKDDVLNLNFDQNTDLERKIMDNKAIRSFGVSSNTGTIDSTIPDPTTYILDPLNDIDLYEDFDWDY